jgi:hypothetical protein
MPPEDPIVHAMLLCDHVYYDPASGKHTLIGVFDSLWHPGRPAALGEAVIFLSLTNMRGEYAVETGWLRGDTEAELARVSVDPVTVADPLARLSVEIDAAGLPLPVAGRYVLRLRVNGRHVHDSVIMVRGDRE